MTVMARPSLVLVGHDVYEGSAPASGRSANIAAALADVLGMVDWLTSEGYRFVALEEFLARRSQGGLALLTFDDAYASVCELLFPHLLARRVPVLMFTVSQTVTAGRTPYPLWLHALRDARDRLAQSRFTRLRRSDLVERIETRCGASLAEVLSLPLPTVSELFTGALDQDDRDALSDLVETCEPALRVSARPDQLHTLLKSGLGSLGAHSQTHRPFTSLTKSEITAEIVDSTAAIAAFVGSAPSDVPFAYPYGAVTTHAEQVVGQECAAGFTTRNRPTTRLDSSASLPRINLDSNARSRIETSGALRRQLAWANERARLSLRTGPAWGLIGPIYRGLRPAARRPLVDDPRPMRRHETAA